MGAARPVPKLNHDTNQPAPCCAPGETSLSDSKQDESFRVIDRRLFNPDGEIRDEAARAERHQKDAEPAPAPPSAPATAAKPSAPIPAHPSPESTLGKEAGNTAAPQVNGIQRTSAVARPRNAHQFCGPECGHAPGRLP